MRRHLSLCIFRTLFRLWGPQDCPWSVTFLRVGFFFICSSSLRVRACSSFIGSAEIAHGGVGGMGSFLHFFWRDPAISAGGSFPPGHRHTSVTFCSLPATVAILFWDWMSFPPMNRHVQSEVFQTVPT